MSRRALVCVLMLASAAQALSVEKSERFRRFMTGAGNLYDRPRLARHLNKSEEHVKPPGVPFAFKGDGNEQSISASAEDIEKLPPPPSGFKATVQLGRESEAPSTVHNDSFGVEQPLRMSRNREDFTSQPNIVNPTADSDQILTPRTQLKTEEISLFGKRNNYTRRPQNTMEDDVEKRITFLNNETTSSRTTTTGLVEKIDNKEWDPINVYSFSTTTRKWGDTSTSRTDNGGNDHIPQWRAQYKTDQSSDKANLGDFPIIRTNFLEWPIYVYPFPEIKTQSTKKPVESKVTFQEKYRRPGQNFDKDEILSTDDSFKEDRVEKLGEIKPSPKQHHSNQQLIRRKLNQSNNLTFVEEPITHIKGSSNKQNSDQKSQEPDQPSRLTLVRSENTPVTERPNKFHIDKVTAPSGKDNPIKVSLGGTITSQSRGKPYKFIVDQVKSSELNRRSDNRLIGENLIAKAYNSDIILKSKAIPQNRYGVDKLMVRVETKETRSRSDKLLLGEQVVAREHAKLVHDINALLEYNGWSALRDDETTTEQRDESDSIYIEDVETRTHPPLVFSTAAPRAPAVNLKIIPKTSPPSKPAVAVPVVLFGGDTMKQPMKSFPTKHPYPFVGAASTTFPMRYRPMMYGYPVRSKPTLWQRFVALFPRIIR